MSNLLTNAGFLDDTNGWAGSAQLALAVDEATRGAPGRAVLLGAGATTGANQKQWLASAPAGRAVVTAGQEIEVAEMVAAFVNAAPVQPTVRLVFYTAGAAEVGPQAVDVLAPEMPQYGVALHGVRQSFYRAFGRFTVPATAVRAALEVSVTPAANGSAVLLAKLKPRIGIRIAGRFEPMAFDPGLHTTADLQLGAWPGVLQPFDVAPGGERLADSVEFQAGPTSPQSRPTSRDPARKYSGQLRCNAIQRAVLEAHWAAKAPFYIVEPDSDRLCVGRFAADGAPRMADDMGVESLMSVGLWLETA